MKTPSLRELFYSHDGNLIHKWDHYFDIYEKYFSKYRGKELNILEIGISHGGSLQLWKKYFGDGVNIYAIDINPECQKFEDDQTKIFIGSQSDRQFLESVISQIPLMDIIIDDGGHRMDHQLVSFEMLYMKVKEGGIYLVEDTHTSYWTEFYGGLRNPGSFIEKSKGLIDSLYESHIHEKERIETSDVARHIQSIAFYDSIVVFEKHLRAAPFHTQVGHDAIVPFDPVAKRKPSFLEVLFSKFKKKQRHTFEVNDRGRL